MENYKIVDEKLLKEVQEDLLLELKKYGKKLNLSKTLIILSLLMIPVIMFINILGFFEPYITITSILISIFVLIFSIKNFNYNKVICSTHIWLLDFTYNNKKTP